MNQLDPKVVADNLQRITAGYCNDMANATSDIIRPLFIAAMTAAGLDTVVEIADPANALLELGKDGAPKLLSAGVLLNMQRVLSPAVTWDVTDLQLRPGAAIEWLKQAITAYCKSLPAGVMQVTMPRLFVSTEAFSATTFIWGYAFGPKYEQ